AGGLLRRNMLKHARRTVHEVLSELTDDARLRAVLCGQFGDYGLPPQQASFSMHAAVVNHYLGGGAYPVGGSGRIAETILPRIEAAGGRVLTSAEVTEILIHRGKAVGVKMADGRELTCPIVVSDAGASNTFERLLPAPSRPKKISGGLAAVRPSVAHASIYLGFEGTAETLGLSRSNIWRYPHDDFDKAIGDYLADDQAPLPLAYLSFPSAKDPSFESRYPGKSTVEVVTLAPYERFAAWSDKRWKKRGEDYESKKAALSERLLEALYAEHPQLEAHLDHAELSTPLSTQHFAGFADGEIYGLEHTPTRFEQTWLRPKTPISGLYLTGSDVCTAGVGGALMGGVLTASALTGKNLIGALAKQPSKPVNAEMNPRWAS
ncbi:MAG: FAD-dependent oxidoreductase, partial [Myxococcota bacterium]